MAAAGREEGIQPSVRVIVIDCRSVHGTGKHSWRKPFGVPKTRLTFDCRSRLASQLACGPDCMQYSTMSGTPLLLHEPELVAVLKETPAFHSVIPQLS